LFCGGRWVDPDRVARALIVDHPDRGIEHRRGEHHNDQQPE
jgi:hypothetical protein